MASAVDGHNVCVFAYGQTGSGKTHTVYGDFEFVAGAGGKGKENDSSSSSGLAAAGERNSPPPPSSSPSSSSLLEDPCDPSSAAGLAPRAAVELFRLLDEGRKAGALAEAEVRVSMLELYCDELTDLLPSSSSPSSSSSSSSSGSAGPAWSSRAASAAITGSMHRNKSRKLEIKRDPRTGTVAVPGAARAKVSSAGELLSTIVSAAARRHVSATLVRSFIVFPLPFPFSELFFVDCIEAQSRRAESTTKKAKRVTARKKLTQKKLKKR